MTEYEYQAAQEAMKAAIRLIDQGYQGLARDVLVDAADNQEGE